MNFLFECAPIESTTGVPVTYRFASLNGLSNSTLIDGKEWDAAIVETPVTSAVFYQSGLVQQTSVDYGSITIQLTSATANLTKMQWDGATGRVWVGVAGQPFASYEKVFEGKLGAHSKTSDALKIPLYGLDFKLNETEILTSTYAGTGGAEGSAGIKGNYKPRAYGVCRYVTPQLINEAYQVYQVHDGACADITNVFEYAISNPKLVGNVVTTYAQLIALDLQPGTWAKAPAIGMFRMGSVPSGKFTADVIGDVAAGLNLASISRAILIGAGMVSSDIDASLESVAGSIAWNAYITDQAMVGETLRTAFASAFLYANSNEAGKFQVGSWLANGATLNVGGPNATLDIILGSLSLEEAAPANYSVTINAEKCWTVHSADDISPAILDLQEGQDALIAAAQAAKATADQAAADIIVEKARTDAILNDGILDRNEKAERKLAYAGITTDYAKNISQATGYGISTTAYANAYAALGTYLNGLSPAWNDLTQDTPITRSTWDAAWEGERAQRFAILRAIADATSKLSAWDGVSGPGKPEDGATVGGIIGSNIKNPDGTIYTPPSAGQLVDNTPPGAVTNLALTSAITDAGVDLNITWTGPTDSDLAGYDLAIKQGTGGYIVFVTTDAAYKFAAQPRNTDFTAKVRAYDKAGNRGVYTAEKTFRTAKDSVPPAPVTAITIEPAFQTAFVSFTAPADLDTATVSVNLNDAAGTLVKTVRVSVSPGGRGQVSFSSLNKATSYSITTFATDDSGNNSTSTGPTAFVTAGGIDVADFTPGVSPFKTFATLPSATGYTGPSLILVQADGKLYRYVGGAWTKAVDGLDIATGTLPGVALVDKGVTAVKIGDGAVTARSIAANSVNANQLSVQTRPVSVAGINIRVDPDLVVRWDAGAITYPDANGTYVTKAIKAGAVIWNTGWLYPVNLSFDTSADTGLLPVLYTTTLPDYPNHVPIAIWSGGTELALKAGVSTYLNGDRLVTGSIKATKIVGKSIGADQLMAGSITADEIKVGTIGAAQIAAGAITANKLLIANMTQLNPDPGFRDTSSWINVGPFNGPLGTSAGSVGPGWYNSHGTDIDSQMGTKNYAMLWGAYLQTTARQHLYSNRATNVKGGVVYQLGALLWNNSNQDVTLTCRCYNIDGTFMGDAANLTWRASTGRYPQSVQFTMFDNVTTYEFILYNAADKAFAGYIVATDIQLTQAVGATSILNGAITTDKLVANAVTADKILGGTITGDKFNTATNLPGTITIGTTGVAIGTVQAQANGSGALNWYDASAGNQYNFYGNKVTRDLALTGWYSNAYTKEVFRNAATITATIDTTDTFFGLTAGRPYNNNTDFTTISYSLHRSSNGNLYAYESGAQTLLGRDAGDGISYSIVYDGRTVTYIRDNDSLILRQIVAAPNLVLAGAVSIYAQGKSISKLKLTGGMDNSLNGADPAARINAYSTQIDPGKITISGGTTLASWRGGGDNTQINGGAIATNTIKANSVSVGLRGITVLGCDFRYEAGRLFWSDGHVFYTDDNGNAAAPQIAAGSCAWGGGSYNYIVWAKGAGSFYQTVDNWQSSMTNGSDSIIMVTWRNGSNFVANHGGTIISGDRIVTNSITASQIATGAITADKMTIGDPTGARLALANNLISGYFANGNIAFQIGVF